MDAFMGRVSRPASRQPSVVSDGAAGDSVPALLRKAEESLVLNRFAEAEEASREVLRRTVYLPGSEHLEDRAATVLLQTLQETRRFPLARKALAEAFGSLRSTPPSSLLLYLSLALDYGELRAEAEALIQELLQTRLPWGVEAEPGTDAPAGAGTGEGEEGGPDPTAGDSSAGPSASDLAVDPATDPAADPVPAPAGTSLPPLAPTGGSSSGARAPWPRRHASALLHLYLFEVLAPGLSEPTQARRWLAETRLGVPASLRAELERELRASFPPRATSSSASEVAGRARRASSGAILRRLARRSKSGLASDSGSSTDDEADSVRGSFEDDSSSVEEALGSGYVRVGGVKRPTDVGPTGAPGADTGADAGADPRRPGPVRTRGGAGGRRASHPPGSAVASPSVSATPRLLPGESPPPHGLTDAGDPDVSAPCLAGTRAPAWAEDGGGGGKAAAAAILVAALGAAYLLNAARSRRRLLSAPSVPHPPASFAARLRAAAGAATAGVTGLARMALLMQPAATSG